MNCIIVEDQAPAQRVLKKYIADMGSLTLKGTFSDALQALEFLKSEPVDLMFLDIHLPKISGIDFLKTLTNPPAVILTTAFSDYAVQSYELNVVDYLLKPFSFERFVKAVTKVTPSSTAYVATPVSSGLECFIKSGYEYIKINSNEVVCIQSDMDYTELLMEDGKKHLAQETLSYWEQKLRNHQFVRVHKSHLVNLAKIEKIAGNQIHLTNQHTTPIGRAYKEAFLLQFVK